MALTRPKIWDIDTGINYFMDPITTLHQGSTQANVDVGFIFNRANGLVTNTAFYWNETTQSFVTAYTTSTGVTDSNITVTSYANITVGNVYASGLFWASNGAVIQTGGGGGGGTSITYTAATTAPGSGNNKGDQWFDTVSGALFEYQYDGTNYQWVDITTPVIQVPTQADQTTFTGNLSAANLVAAGQATVTYTPSAINGAAIQVSAKGTQGGTNYADMLKLTTIVPGATTPSKWIRLDNNGTLQIINNAYNTNIFNLSDTGALTVPGPFYINGLQAVNGPTFQAFLLQATAFSTGTTANVVYQGSLYDTHSCYNTSTGVFKPNVAGYYQFNWTAGANSYPASTGIVTSSLRRNNQEYARGFRGTCSTSGIVVNGSAQCYLNGSTDYVHVTFLQGSGGTAYLENDANALSAPGSYANYFSGSMIRGA